MISKTTFNQLKNTVSRMYPKNRFFISHQENTIIFPCFIMEPEEAPENIENKNLNVTKIYDEMKNAFYKEVSFPDPEEIKKNITLLSSRKYSKTVIYNGGIYTVNARIFYLLCELLKVYSVGYSGENKPLLLEGEKGRAYLLPVIRGFSEKGYSVV